MKRRTSNDRRKEKRKRNPIKIDGNFCNCDTKNYYMCIEEFSKCPKYENDNPIHGHFKIVKFLRGTYSRKHINKGRC